MASRYLYQYEGAFEPGIVEVFAKVSFGATGAPTIVQAAGVKSITRSGAGAYTIVFGSVNDKFTGDGVDRYEGVLAAPQPTFLVAGATDPAAPFFKLVADNTATATGSVDVLFMDADTPAGTDPASGEVVLVSFKLQNFASNAGF